MPRFVILEHDHPGVHWDLLLEDGPAMLTWSLEQAPDTAGPIAARALPDHRLEFLEYEGPISGDRGHVAHWDRGTFDWLERAPDGIAVHVHGQRIQGACQLCHAEAGWTFRTPSAP